MRNPLDVSEGWGLDLFLYGNNAKPISSKTGDAGHSVVRKQIGRKKCERTTLGLHSAGDTLFGVPPVGQVTRATPTLGSGSRMVLIRGWNPMRKSRFLQFFAELACVGRFRALSHPKAN